MADAPDLKSVSPKDCEGSTPFSGTNLNAWIGPPKGEAYEELGKLVRWIEKQKRKKTMTNKQAELYFRNICRGDKANNDVDMETFLEVAEYTQSKEEKKEAPKENKRILIFADGKWAETTLEEMEMNKNLAIKVVGPTLNEEPVDPLSQKSEGAKESGSQPPQP